MDLHEFHLWTLNPIICGETRLLLCGWQVWTPESISVPPAYGALCSVKVSFPFLSLVVWKSMSKLRFKIAIVQPHCKSAQYFLHFIFTLKHTLKIAQLTWALEWFLNQKQSHSRLNFFFKNTLISLWVFQYEWNKDMHEGTRAKNVHEGSLLLCGMLLASQP